ncbi:MAG: DUF6599 family protein [Candidatus Aminicenantales bacterium]
MSTKTAKRVIPLVLSLFGVCSAFGQEMSTPSLQTFLPRLSGWSLSEAPRGFSPGTLFEYINGAAENYLSYGFRELLVSDFKKDESTASLTVEIYDMGDETRAFGVYSSERYPESRFLNIGNQGYLEEGTLNFIVGGLYVKLLCFDCGEGAEEILRSVAQQVETKVPVKGQLPLLLGLFPGEGLVANSEKFVLQNVLGFGFLHHGYLADYRAQGQQFELFIIQGTSPQDAEDMLGQYLESQRKTGQPPQKTPLGYQVRDRYSHNIYVAISGNMILGVMRIKDGFEALGKKYLGWLVRSVNK